MKRLDVRRLPKPERHPKIFAEFDALAEGESLQIVSDHEPRPLRYEFERTRRGRFSWSQRNVEEHHWEALIRRTSAEPAALEPAVLLKKHPVFAEMNEKSLIALTGGAKINAVPRNRAIVDQGLTWPYLGLVVSGMVQACTITPAGREVALHDYLPNDLFGEIAFLDGGAAPVRYLSRTEDTRVMLLSRTAVLAEVEHDAKAALALAGIVAQNARLLIERIAALAAQPIVARLALALLPYAPPQDGMHPPLGPLAKVRQVELAAAAGTSKDLAYRGLAELEAAEAIVRDRGYVVALDRGRLEDFAQVTKY